ncbi:Sodium/hydrogen exchanger [Hypoxylon rubiginosum]|uniref:Sodium/hydrogen exchanger n=1 Tax=Hypoxylon rubiginosum TaxID=110542 RepID=A0ACC0CTB2_9PEZI|nr:Sodium/hydrogen exchanger [Hypoxylon rubiginosum]
MPKYVNHLHPFHFTMSSLSYEEPSITQILVLSSFLLALNAADAVLDRTLYCGLVGQVLIGVAWGAPGAGWLSHDIQVAVVQIGYLGLILIVFEGGAATPIASLRRNLGLSAAVALTGVAAPVALSFGLLSGPLTNASKVQCFAAAAALCSTSLGTTFAVLGASGLVDTRLGSVLGTAAMMDDVVGLVMVQIVASLGGSGGEVGVDIDVANTVVRPVLVSVAFAVAVPLACRFVLRPLISLVNAKAKAGEGMAAEKKAWWQKLDFPDATHIAFIAQTALLIALVVGTSYAGASVLLAAYLAGIVVSWWQDSQHGDIKTTAGNQSPEGSSSAQGNKSTDESTTVDQASGNSGDNNTQPTAHLKEQQQQQQSKHSTPDVYGLFYSQAVSRILKPFFFASIGFSIPISDMFSGDVLWRGVIYSILMAIGKILCGLWLVRFPISMSGLAGNLNSFVSSRYDALFSRFRRPRTSKPSPPSPRNEAVELVQQPGSTTLPQATRNGETPSMTQETSELSQEEQQPSAPSTPAKPLSLYPAAIMSSAMVARGEIGFLISAVAESNGVFRRPSDAADAAASGLFLIVTWAIVLCTVVGPISVGLLVRRVKKLEGHAASVADRGRDVLGVWGVQ